MLSASCGWCWVVGESKWLSTSSWECEQSGFVDFPEVSMDLLRRIRTRFQPLTYGPIRVYYVCGADHAAKCRLGRGIDHDIGNQSYSMHSYELFDVLIGRGT
jgi:hypothetical protein